MDTRIFDPPLYPLSYRSTAGPQRVGQELGARYVMEESLRQAGTLLRATSWSWLSGRPRPVATALNPIDGLRKAGLDVPAA